MGSLISLLDSDWIILCQPLSPEGLITKRAIRVIVTRAIARLVSVLPELRLVAKR